MEEFSTTSLAGFPCLFMPAAVAAACERRRIAREFHDSLEQDFSGLALRLDSAAGSVAEAEARRVMERQREIVARLGIAKRTARCRVVAVQKKFDAANNAEVVAHDYKRSASVAA